MFRLRPSPRRNRTCRAPLPRSPSSPPKTSAVPEPPISPTFCAWRQEFMWPRWTRTLGPSAFADSPTGYGDKVLVVIDGRSAYTPTSSGVNWDQQDLVLED